jgi:hypothetical protein
MTRPRPGFGSRPDLREPHAPDVYEILEKHDTAIGRLEGLAQEGKLADAQILTELKNIQATDRHATTKLIAGLVVTVITTLGGVIGTIAAMRPGQPPAPVAVPRSPIDACRAMPLGPSRIECFTRAAEDEARR